MEFSERQDNYEKNMVIHKNILLIFSLITK